MESVGAGGKQPENVTAEVLQRLAHVLAGGVLALRLPWPQGGKAPLLPPKADAPQNQAQQLPLLPWRRLELQLHQHTATGQAWAPAGKMKTQVNGVGLLPTAGAPVVSPGAKIGPPVRETLAEGGGHTGNDVGKLRAGNLMGGVHGTAVRDTEVA